MTIRWAPHIGEARRIALLALLAMGVATAFATRAPEGISASYSPALDGACAILRAQHIESAWSEELVSHLAEYRSLWSGNGPRMLSEAERISGLERPRRTRVHLTLCDLPSRSFLGTSVNMRFALKSYTPTPVPLRYKVDVEFHELLHLMLDGHIPDDSHMLVELGAASECVRNHVHLLALQKAVLIELGQGAELADVVRIDSLLPEGCYKKAWSEVNASESRYRSYVSELRK